MDVRKEIRIVAFVFMLFVGCITEETSDSGYIFTASKSITTNAVNQLQLIRYCDPAADDSLIVKLFYTESYNGNETLAQEQEFRLEEGKRDTFLDFFVDSIESENVYSGRLQINGNVCGQCINGSDKVYFSTTKEYIYLIQTDKPIYKPGQTVKFRVLKLDKHLKPSSEKDDVGEVYVDDTKGTRLFQFKDVPLGKGIKQMEFPLSDEPNLGNWRITVWNNNVTESQTFEVKEYELPKFDVNIKFPPFVLANAKSFPVEVCARYTYGKPVKGILKLNASLEIYSYSRDKTPKLQESFEIDGCYNYTINVTKIDPNSYRYRRIMVQAKVIETGTGVERSNTQYLTRQYSPLNLNFNVENNYRQYFKPGLPYNGKLKVTNPDESPAPGEPIEICATVDRKRVMMGWLAEKKVKVCKNYTSDEDGIIKFILEPQSTDAESVQLEAKSLKYARNSQNPGLDNLNEPSTGISLSPYFSPSGSFIQLQNVGSAIPCGTQKNIKLLFTAKENTEFQIRYEIIRQGNVVQTGTKDVQFNVEDDVSQKFDNEDELIKGPETQLVPAPELTSSDSDSSDDDENCKSAKDSKYKPYIGETYVPVDVDASLSPSFTLLVFYVKTDTETVADSQKIEVQKCFKNEVEFEFGDEAKQPGTKTSITVKSSPNSLCGIKVVDKSVLLLNSNDQLTKEKIFQIIERFDNGVYYSSNPCNEAIPQPGLYSAKASGTSIAFPPYWSTSTYQDSLTAFQNSGLVVISDLKIFTRPCHSGGGYGGRPIFQSESFSGNVRYKKKGHAVALASTARRPAAPAAAGGFAADSKVGVADISATKSVVDVRDFFPETWLFEMLATDSDGNYVHKETLPHTITEWVGSAVCVNEEDGLGLSDTDTIKGFQAFFISFTLPYGAIRGEIITIVVSIYNYRDDGSIPVIASLVESDQYTVTNGSLKDDEMCIGPNESKNVKIQLKPLRVGTVNVTARAETAATNEACGSATVIDSLAKDAITQSIVVEPPGFPVETVQTILVCPTDSEEQTYRGSMSLDLPGPDNYVDDSARVIVDVTGNVMGKTIDNVDRLVSLPTGCGEQNLVKFVPNYLVLRYLSGIGQLDEKTRKKAISNLDKGYQRELTYRHSDGSFSAFGETDPVGSMFLTSFVLKSFYEAQQYIYIDPTIMTTAQNWIASKQQADGCFPNVGQIIDRGIQGGLEKEKITGHTCYVVAALLISKYENETVINNAMSCCSSEDTGRPYETVLVAFAEALAGKTESAKKRLDEMLLMANKTEGVEYFKNPNGTKSLDLETAAYFVRTSILVGRGPEDCIGFIRYMTQNLNPYGGFYSTQDTCVGLEALSEFAALVYKDPVDIQCLLSGILDKEVVIDQDNKLLVQRNLVKDVPGELKFEVSGSGCAVIQAALRYNTINPPKQQSFYLEVVVTCKDTDCTKREITGIASYVPSGKAAGMSILQIKMQSGCVPNKESLDKVKADKNNKCLRVEYEGNTASFYFAEIDNKGVRITFTCDQVVIVDDPQPASAKVFDYYAPEYYAETSYTYLGSEVSESSPESGSPEP